MIRYLLVNVKAPNFYTLTIFVIRRQQGIGYSVCFVNINYIVCVENMGLK